MRHETSTPRATPARPANSAALTTSQPSVGMSIGKHPQGEMTMKDTVSNVALITICQTGGFGARADVARACGIDPYSESLVLSGLFEIESSLDAPDSMPAGSVERSLGVIGGSYVYRD